MSIKADRWIMQQAIENEMIVPFVDHLVRINKYDEKIISYGVSSYGYDIRLADEYKVFTNAHGNVIIDPKDFDTRSFVDVKDQGYCIIPPNSFALGRSVEYIRMPRNVTGLVLGKSSYARCGIVANFTPLEACFSDDTEILTPDGWRFFEDIKIGDLVLGVDTEGNAVWQPVEATQKYEYEGNLHHYQGRSVDLLVTPEHKLYVNRRSNSEGWHTKISKDVFGKYAYEMNRIVKWKGEKPADTIQIGKNIFDLNTFLIFLGLWLGDGCVYFTEGGNYIIQLAALKERKILFAQEIFDRLGLKATKYDQGFRIFNKDLYEFLLPYKHALNKSIPNFVWEYDPETLRNLWVGLLNSDGNAETNTYTTISKQLADDVQRLAFMMGEAAIVRKRPAEDTGIKGRQVRGKNDVYVIRITNGHMTPEIQPKKHLLRSYKGFVYDVTVPNHLIFVRRNGKAVWSGNCWEGFITIEISNTSPLPAKVYSNEGFAQILFLESDQECLVSYADRGGKYQGQTSITLAKV